MGLFGPDWNSKNEIKALAAVNKLFACDELQRAAGEARYPSVRLAAIKMLTAKKYRNTVDGTRLDQSVLAEIAEKDDDFEIRMIVTGWLADQSALARIALHDKSAGVRGEAVKKLSDQSILATIALHDEMELVAADATERLTNQSVLTDIALHGNLYTRAAAIRKLTDQSLLYNIARYDENTYASEVAAGMLVSQSELIDVALHGNCIGTRLAAAAKVCDPSILHVPELQQEYCKKGKHQWLRVETNDRDFGNGVSSSYWVDRCIYCGKTMEGHSESD